MFGQKSKNGRTIYHTAVLHGHLDILKLLILQSRKHLKNSTDLGILSLKDSCGITPFTDAILGIVNSIKFFK